MIAGERMEMFTILCYFARDVAGGCPGELEYAEYAAFFRLRVHGFYSPAFLRRGLAFPLLEDIDAWAARVDGATRWQILWNVIVPMARSGVAVLALSSFIGYRNNFLWPLIVGNTHKMVTVLVELNLFNGQHGTEWGTT